MAKRYYQGSRTAAGAFVWRPGGGPLDPRRHLWEWGSGMEWGYDGSGPAQTALAILADHIESYTGLCREDAETTASLYHLDFKRHIVSCLPSRWAMDVRVVDEFRRMTDRRSSGHDVSWGLWRSSLLERGLVVEIEGRMVTGREICN